MTDFLPADSSRYPATTALPGQPPRFLAGGGEMGHLTRTHNWAGTSLGTPDTWPQSLRTTLGILLHSAFPMFLFWGDERLCFYNDAYRPSLGTNGKHPALGKPGNEVWPEIRDFIGPLIEQVTATGEPVFFEDQLVPIFRNGQLEDVYWTFSYSPAYGDDGQINGVLVVCTETTEKVARAKQQQETTALLQAVFDSSQTGISVLKAVRNQPDEPEPGGITDFAYQLVNRVTGQFNNRTDLVGQRYGAVHTAYKQTGLFDDFVRAIETGDPVRRELHYAGEGFDNWYATTAVKNDDGVVLSFIDITTERTAWQKIRESEQRFQAAVAAVQGVLWTNNATGEMTGEQPGWAALTGQTYDEYQGYGWSKAVHPDDAQPTVDAWQEALRDRKRFEFEHRVRLHNGEWGLFSIRAVPILNADGSIREWVGVHTDITGQRRAEEELIRFRYMAENASDPFILMREDGTFAYLNQLALDRWGYTADEARHIRVPDVDPLYTDEVFGAAFARAQQEKIPPFETLHKRKDDHVYSVEVNMGGLMLAGKPHLFAVARDITARKQAEENLRQSEAQFRNVTNSSPTGLWLSDETGSVTYLNQTLIDWTGMPHDALLGAGWAEAIIDEDRPRSVEAFLTAIASRAHYDVMFRLNKSDGSVIWCQAAGDPYYDGQGRCAGYAGFCMDIDELVKQRQKLAGSEARLRSLIDNAPAAIALFVGRDLIIDLPNQAFIDVVGKGSDIAGKPLGEVMPELESQPFLQLLDGVYTSGRQFQSFGSEIEVVQNGKPATVYYNLTYTPLLNEAGEVYAILNIGIDVAGQVQAQQKVEASEARYRSLVSQAVVPTAVFRGRNMVLELANDAVLALWDKNSSILGQTLLEFLPELADQPFPALLDGVFTTGETLTAQEAPVRLERNGNTEIVYMDFSYQAMRDTQQTITGILVMATDVTERVLVRQQIKASEQRFQTLIRDADVGIVVLIGPEMTVEIVNEAYARLIGLTPADLLGKPLFSIIPETEAYYRPLLNQVLHSGEPLYLNETPYSVQINGRQITGFLNVTYQPYREENNTITGVTAVCQDVTEQVLARQKIEEAEAALREAIQRLNLAIDAGRLGAYTLDLATGNMDVSEQCRINYGQSPETPFNFPDLIATIVADDRERVQQAITASVETRTVYMAEYRIVWPDGTLHWMQASGQPEYGADGQPIRIIGVTQEITDQRTMQQELERQVAERTRQLQASVHDLERSNANLQQFAYVASHDLQEPLRKIQSFADLLTTQYGDQLGNGVDFLGRMQSAASRMSLLIRDLLAFSRISTQQDTSAIVLLTGVVQAVLTDLEVVVAETKAEITVDPLPAVRGDASQLRQLFQNLLSNALKFRLAGLVPVVRVGCQTVAAADLPPSVRPARPAPAYYQIDVTDNGIGFDEKYLDRIFQVFQRLHGRTEFAGTGIGLAICEKVVANHGGAITASSQPGQGATFSVFLPQ